MTLETHRVYGSLNEYKLGVLLELSFHNNKDISNILWLPYTVLYIRYKVVPRWYLHGSETIHHVPLQW